MTKIELVDASLRYPIFNAECRSLRNVVFSSATGGTIRQEARNVVSIHALDSINLSIASGDRVALLGMNGAGKTTLLKLMAGVLAPSSGTIAREGSIALMLGLLPSTDIDASGLENIYMSGYARGLNRSTIESLVPEIVEFSGLGNFINMPMRSYSRGMFARLVFSTNINIPADIVLVDEVFGAGDASFVEKARIKMVEYMENSKLFVFASHNENLLKTICNKGVLLDHGKIICTGAIADVLSELKKIAIKSEN